MKPGLARAHRLGISIHPQEEIRTRGDFGWLIVDKDGFEPCPWAAEVAHFCPIRGGDTVADLGCGAGALLVTLSRFYPELKLCVGVELDPVYADQARRNIQINGLDSSFVVRGDIRQVSLKPAFDLVVSNPPFYPPGWGRQSSVPRVARATHALHGNVDDFVFAATRILKPNGQFILIYDSCRLAEALMSIARNKLVTKKIRFIQDDRKLPSRVLILAGQGGHGVYIDHVQHSSPGDENC